MNFKDRMLSKSQINLFRQCPMKWKKAYIDREPFKPTPAMERGIRIHKKIENFYKDIVIKNGIIQNDDPELTKLVEFENQRLKDCNHVLKYFIPLHQELKIADVTLHLRGIIDAVFRHPKDDKIIIIDWKSGLYRPWQLNDYRFELAIYKKLYEKVKKIEVGYWGIFFTDAGKLFFEETKTDEVDKAMKIVEQVREEMAVGNYLCKCGYCERKGGREKWRKQHEISN